MGAEQSSKKFIVREELKHEKGPHKPRTDYATDYAYSKPGSDKIPTTKSKKCY